MLRPPSYLSINPCTCPYFQSLLCQFMYSCPYSLSSLSLNLNLTLPPRTFHVIYVAPILPLVPCLSSPPVMYLIGYMIIYKPKLLKFLPSVCPLAVRRSPPNSQISLPTTPPLVSCCNPLLLVVCLCSLSLLSSGLPSGKE